MAIKIDLEKAYNKLEWSFIRDMLIRANLPTNLIDIIMSCISTVSTSILFNGEALDPIYPSRGIRQGDPPSPYLFILCMEFLGQLIEEKCNAKLWQPMKASCGGPAFSHLFFANDLVLFAKADHVNCSTVRDVINAFCNASGQLVSAVKSRVYFSPRWIGTLGNHSVISLDLIQLRCLASTLEFLLSTPVLLLKILTAFLIG